MSISSPYNFVPLNKYVYTPDWANLVSQDIPFEDGEDGWIEIVWKNYSPLCIRDASEKGEKGNEDKNDKSPLHSVRIKDSEGFWRYFIPGSSIKGMIRSIMSVMSYGKMEQYDNKSFGHREIPKAEYRNKMSNAKFGWLKKEDDEKYVLYPCSDSAEKITIKDLEKLYPGYNEEKSAWKRNEKINNNTFPYYEKEGIKYRIFATGKMDNKKHELLIPCNKEGKKIVSKSVKDSFFTIYEVTPDFEHYREMLEAGEEIPVSFTTDRQNEISAIGMGKMFRYPYKNDINTLVRNSQDPLSYEGKRDLCETIFGWAEKQDSMKGRVQISNAFMVEGCKCEMQEVKGVFGEPKPSFFPFYIMQDGIKYKTYDDGEKISGRKFYRIHKGSSTMPPPKGNKEDNKVETCFIPIPENKHFLMRINIHNLRKVEIGALLAAITFNHTEGTFHNIGAAKGFGYGKIRCEEITLNGLKFKEEEYLKAFEKEMAVFAKEKLNESYTSSNSIQTLIGIASEHRDEDVRQMEMENAQRGNEFENCKNNFETLKEPGRRMNNYVSRKDEFKAKHKKEFEEILKTLENPCFKERLNDVRHNLNSKASNLNYIRPSFDDKASCEESIKNQLVDIDNSIAEIENLVREIDNSKNILVRLIYEMKSQDIDHAEETEWRRIFEETIQTLNDEKTDLTAKKEELIKTLKVQRGLDAILNEKYPNKDEYKINEWKVCRQRIEKWQRDKGLGKDSNELTPEEINAVKSAVTRLYLNPHKKEKKDFTDFNSNIWESICKYISTQEAEKIFHNR